MRILLLSDLHLEFGDFRPPPADVVILAGDIWYRDKGIFWAAEKFAPDRTIVLVGNHEFYKGELHDTLDACRAAATQTGVHFLENESVIIDGVRFIGCCLWPDFRLNGQDGMLAAMKASWRYMNDFRLIRIRENEKSRRIIPADVIYLNRASRQYLAAELGKPFGGKTVVATHFPPSPRSIADKYLGDPTAPYYCANLEDVILTSQPDLWVHGHTHDTFDYRIGETRIVCNPRGYHPEHLNPTFKPDLYIDP